MKLSASCVRAAAIRFSLALMMGLLAVSGYIVAPVLFAHAGSAELAGMLAGNVFHLANTGVLILGVAVASFWLRGGSAGKLNWSLMLILLAAVAANEFALAPVMQEIKQAAGPMDALAKDDPQRMAFGMWHGISALLHMLASLAAIVLVMLGGAVKQAHCEGSGCSR